MSYSTQTVPVSDLRPGDRLMQSAATGMRPGQPIQEITTTEIAGVQIVTFSTMGEVGVRQMAVRTEKGDEARVSILQRIEDGQVGPYTRSMLVAEQIMRLPPDDVRAEIATMLRALWDYQGRGGHPTYPTQATRERWAAARRRMGGRRL